MIEVWKDIIGWEGLYQISNHGRVKSLARTICRGQGFMFLKEKILKYNSCGPYYTVHFIDSNNKKSKRMPVHRIIAQHFIDGYFEGAFVNHINGNKRDNRIENLEWCTKYENEIHAKETGLKSHSESHYKTTFNKLEIYAIRLLAKKKISQRAIARLFKSKQQTISSIIRGKNWSKEKFLLA